MAKNKSTATKDKISLHDEKARPSIKNLKKQTKTLVGQNFNSLKNSDKDMLLKMVLERLEIVDSNGIIL